MDRLIITTRAGDLVTIEEPVTITMSPANALSPYHALGAYLIDLRWRIRDCKDDRVRQYMISNYDEVEHLRERINESI